MMQRRVLAFLAKYKLIPIAAVVFILCYIVNPFFISEFSIMALLQDTAIFGFLVLGGALVVLTGGIDLSVGNMASMSSVIAAWLMINLQSTASPEISLFISIVVTVAVCAFFGFLTGTFVTELKIPPLISTLGMMWVVKGIGYYVLKGVPTPYPVKAFGNIFAGGITFLPYSIIYLSVSTVVLAIVLGKLRWGRSIYATGGNEYAAFISGVDTGKVKRHAYMLSGLLAGFAGLLVGSYSAVGYPRACDGYELHAIAAIVMGGIALTGGEGRLWNAIIGIFILRMLNKLVLFSGLAGYIEGMIIGTIIVIILIASSRTEKGGSSWWLKITKYAANNTQAAGGDK